MLKGAILLIALCASVLYADSIGTISFSGSYGTPPEVVCQGTDSCHSALTNVNAIAGIDGTASFTQVPFGGAPVYVFPNQIPSGSYLLAANLSAFEGPIYDTSSVRTPDPDLVLMANFNIPLNSGTWQVTTPSRRT